MKRWYVIQVYAGYEGAVKDDLMRRIDAEGFAQTFGSILVPSAHLEGFVDLNDRKSRDNQLFPGYLLVEVDLNPETMRFVLTTPRVIRFLGGKDPAPLSAKEIDRIMRQIKGEVAVAPKKSEFEMGAEVEISQGPFAGFFGTIERIDDEAERMTVMVSIFGRRTPVELKFDHIKR